MLSEKDDKPFLYTKEQIQVQRNNFKQRRDKNLTQHHQFIQRKIQQFGISQQNIQKIVSCTATDLAKKMNNGQLSSQIITVAYCANAFKVGEIYNLITEDNFLQAVEAAQRSDKIRAERKAKNWSFGQQWNMEKFLPPLFGIPISIKDSIDMNGFATTVGITARSFHQKKDGVMLSGIRGAGMIPFVRTNAAQLAMTFDSNNYLWGRSLNPWNPERTVGGSSGGEAGLICSGGSPIGMGADIGGSIRIPAEFCGICALKPNTSRLSFNGHTQYEWSMQGNRIQQTMGPFGKQVQDLALWMKSLTEQQFYHGHTDPYIKLLPFSDSLYRTNQYNKKEKKQKIRIGYIKSLKFCQATSTSQRAVCETIEILAAAGYEIEEIQIPQQNGIIEAGLTDFLGQGGMQSYYNMLKGQDLIPQYQGGAYLSSLDSRCYQTLIDFMSKTGQQRTSFILKATQKKTTHEYLKNCGAIKHYRRIWTQYLKEKSISIVITPGFACQALICGIAGDVFPTAAYTFIWNVLDVPSGSLPITVVRSQEQVYNTKYNDGLAGKIKQSTLKSAGLPAGVQVVGLPFQEERVLHIMKLIQQKVNFRQKFACPHGK